MIEHLTSDENFLGIEEPELCSYEHSSVVIQQIPYEHTSSYKSGSYLGPGAIVDASHYVEFYDEVLDMETYKNTGICTLKPIEFGQKVDAEAVALIEEETLKHLQNGKFVVSLGAEHTISYGLYKAFASLNPDISVLQIDAHSDLRASYHNNPYSHASVMARINDHGPQISQVGIRAQCKEEADLIAQSANIKTWYAHQIRTRSHWQHEVVQSLNSKVYITIDADGFDPSVIPNVGTAEPGGLLWYETLELLKEVCSQREVVGFDIVEVAPVEGNILSEYTLAQLLYRILGYQQQHPVFKEKYCKA